MLYLLRKACHFDEDENMSVVRPWHWNSLVPPSSTVVPIVLSSTNLDLSSAFHVDSLVFFTFPFLRVSHLPYLSKLVPSLVLVVYSWLLTFIPDQSYFICGSWHQLQWGKKYLGNSPLKQEIYKEQLSSCVWWRSCYYLWLSCDEDWG